MRIVLQRVSQASVLINGEIERKINRGFVLLVGIASEDDEQLLDFYAKKICNLRIFADENDKMNLSLQDIDGEILIISQFTLFANTKKGNRPSFNEAASPQIAQKLYQKFIEIIDNYLTSLTLHSKLKTGEFGANMQLSLTNDGPVTILYDSTK